MLKPWMRFGCPANNSETRLMTPGVSILDQGQYVMLPNVFKSSDGRTYDWLLKSFMISRNRLYTSG